jgi:hypothetical protein
MLLDEIISILGNQNGSLNAALLKTKVLLHTIGKKDLATWVDHELRGYPDDKNLPEYRICSSELHATVINLRMAYRDYPLPLSHLDEEQRKSVTVSPCLLSIASIEQAVKDGGKLGRGMPPEFAIFFERALSPGTNIIKMWIEINMVEVANILTEVRSRLLDFLLEIRDVVGMDVPEKELAARTKGVDTETMFTTTILGSHNTVIVGSQNVQVSNQQGDIEGLVKEIAKLGYEQKDLDELRTAVQADKAAGKTPDITEGKTSKWFLGALKTAGKGVLKVGTDVATKVITESLERFIKGG